MYLAIFILADFLVSIAEISEVTWTYIWIISSQLEGYFSDLSKFSFCWPHLLSFAAEYVFFT